MSDPHDKERNSHNALTDGPVIKMGGATLNGKPINFSEGPHVDSYEKPLKPVTKEDLIENWDKAINTLSRPSFYYPEYVREKLRLNAEDMFEVLQALNDHFRSNGLAGVSLPRLKDRIAELVEELGPDPRGNE